MKKKVLIGAGGLLALLIAAVVIVLANLTPVVRSVLEKEVPGLTFKKLDAGWNKVVITGVELKRGDRVVFKVDALRVYPSMTSIFSDTLAVSGIEIDSPYVLLVRNADGSLQLPVPEGMDSEKEKKPSKAEGPRRQLFISRIEIRDGKAEVIDRTVYGAPAKHTLSALDVTVEDIRVPTGPDPIPFDVSARLEGKRPGKISADGWYQPATRSADVDLAFAGLYLPATEPYYRGKYTTASITDGVVDLGGKVKMKSGHYTANLSLTLADLAFAREGLFMGVPVQLFAKHLKDQGKPFHTELTLEGSLDDKEHLQQRLVAAVAKQLVKDIGEEALQGIAEDLKKGDLGAVKDKAGEAGKALESLFGK